MRTFIYFSKFRLSVKYRLEKKHIIPDVLSRLLSGNKSIKLPRKNPAGFFKSKHLFSRNLNLSNDADYYTYQKFMIFISDDFRKQMLDSGKHMQ